MEKKKLIRKIITVAIALMVGVTSGAVMTDKVSAAVKAPAKVTNLKVVEKDSRIIKLQWKKQGKINGTNVKYTVNYKPTNSNTWESKITEKNQIKLKVRHPGRTYQVKVRGYVKTGAGTYKGSFSNTMKVKVPAAVLTIGGKEVQIEDGKTLVIPNPTGSSEYKVKNAKVTDTRGATSGSLQIEGTTTDGLSFWYYYGSNGNTSYMVGEPCGGIWGNDQGGNSLKVEPKNGATAYWTCDGTEPMAGQKDLTGKCRYTRDSYGYMMDKLDGVIVSPEDAYIKTKLRGTTKSGKKYMIFKESPGNSDEKVFWVKLYKNGKLIGEEFMQYNRDGYAKRHPEHYDPEQTKQVCIDALKELDRYDEEVWGPEII